MCVPHALRSSVLALSTGCTPTGWHATCTHCPHLSHSRMGVGLHTRYKGGRYLSFVLHVGQSLSVNLIIGMGRTGRSRCLGTRRIAPQSQKHSPGTTACEGAVGSRLGAAQRKLGRACALRKNLECDQDRIVCTSRGRLSSNLQMRFLDFSGLATLRDTRAFIAILCCTLLHCWHSTQLPHTKPFCCTCGSRSVIEFLGAATFFSVSQNIILG